MEQNTSGWILPGEISLECDAGGTSLTEVPSFVLPAFKASRQTKNTLIMEFAPNISGLWIQRTFKWLSIRTNLR